MVNINTIDLWTEQRPNHYDCFNGAFSDGFENGGQLPYNHYKVILNCNCFITSNKNIPIGNKHNAVIFYKDNVAVRLLVADKDTDIKKCIANALNQQIARGGENPL